MADRVGFEPTDADASLVVNPPTTKAAGFPPLLWEAAF